MVQETRNQSGERVYTVGELADLARVSIRTLHHYDAIGLLTPSRADPIGTPCASVAHSHHSFG